MTPKPVITFLLLTLFLRAAVVNARAEITNANSIVITTWGISTNKTVNDISLEGLPVAHYHLNYWTNYKVITEFKGEIFECTKGVAAKPHAKITLPIERVIAPPPLPGR